MAALDTAARHKGHKAMETAISTAARVRRQLKAGRPRTGSLALNAYEALGILVNQVERARGLMSEAGLNPYDISLRLIIRTKAGMLLKKLPPPEEAQTFFTSVCDAAGQFLGILVGAEGPGRCKGQTRADILGHAIRDGAGRQRQMLALLELIRAGGTQVLSN